MSFKKSSPALISGFKQGCYTGILNFVKKEVKDDLIFLFFPFLFNLIFIIRVAVDYILEVALSLCDLIARLTHRHFIFRTRSHSLFVTVLQIESISL